MDRVVSLFFGNEAIREELRQDLWHSIVAVVPDGSLGWYSALAPDFFAAIEQDIIAGGGR